MNLQVFTKQNPFASFIILALGLSYAAFLLPVTGEGGLLILLTVLAVIPTVAAYALMTYTEGRRSAAAFLRQCLRWRSPLTWYLIAIAIGFLIHLGTSVLALMTGRIPTIEPGALDPTLIFFIPFALMEEIGWRGFGLHRLLDRQSPFTATLMIGIPWGLVHFGLTLFFLPTRSPFVGGLLVLVTAFPLTWIYVRSGRNVFVATVLHFAANAFGSVAGPHGIPEADAFLLQLSIGCLIIAFLILIDHRLWFTRSADTVSAEAVPSTVQM